MKSSILYPLLIASTVLSAGTAVRADTLVIPDISDVPPNASSGVPRPVRGMDMTQVETRFGAPDQKHTAVGDPPITRWDYAKFSVYFEHRHVLYSVVRR